MANNLAKNKAKVQEIPALVLQGFTGLSLKLDFANRDRNSWQQLDNFDLYVPGSLRKILPAVQYGGPYAAQQYNCIEYLAQPNNPQGGIRRLIGVGADGKLYNLATGALYSDTSSLLSVPSTIPFMLQMSGYFVPFKMTSWSPSVVYALNDAVLEYGPDGQLYVFAVTSIGTSGTIEPVWPLNGIVHDGNSPPVFSAVNGGTTVDGGVTWTCLTSVANQWQANHAYVLGDLILDPNGFIQQASSVTANSAANAPPWNPTVGGVTIDGTAIITAGGHIISVTGVEWLNLGNPPWKSHNAYSLGDSIVDQNGNIQEVTTAGTSGNGTAGSLIWTNEGVPNSTRFLENFLVITVPGRQPIRVVEWQYDPANGGETPKVTIGEMGSSPPLVPVNITGTTITPNLNGYAPSAGRAYQWTHYNPQTLQESAPSPFTGQVKIVEIDNNGFSVTLNGSILLPLPPPTKARPFSSYQSFYVAIPLSALTPVIGQGYTTIRIYATQDGGTTFFLVNTLFDNLGNQISNSDGSIPIGTLQALSGNNNWLDYFPLPEAQKAMPSARIFEGSGPVNLAPDPFNLGVDAWVIKVGSGFGTGLFVLTGGAPDGANAWAIDGADTSKNVVKSIAINVTNQTYFFSVYIDNANGTGGTVSAKIQTPAGTVLLTLTQANNVASVLSGTFTPTTAQKRIQIVFTVSGVTITADTTLLFGDPVLLFGSSSSTVPTNYPTTDDELVIPAPAPFTNYPPPIAAMTEVLNDSLHLIDNTDQTKTWYSQQGQYEKFGANAFVRSTVTKNADQIMEIIKCFDRLLLLKGRSIEQITTYPPQTPVPVDPQHGALARRTSITWGSSILGLFTNGLGQVQLAASLVEDKLNVGMATELFGDDVKPIIDSINQATLHATNLGPMLPCPTIFNKLDLLMIAYQVGSEFNDNILIYHLGRSKGFARITALPANVITLKEIQLPPNGQPYATDGDYLMLALTTDSKSYVLFQGTQDGTVTATAVSQPLPTPSDLPPELWNSNKVFRSLWFEGEDLGNWQVFVATDKQVNADGTFSSFPWGPFKIINNKVDIGGIGVAKRIGIKLVHSAACAAGVTPLMTYINVDYDIMAEAN